MHKRQCIVIFHPVFHFLLLVDVAAGIAAVKYYSNYWLLRKLISSVKLLSKLVAFRFMDATNEEIRRQFSERLKKELVRAGLPVSSPTQIANEFNRQYPSNKVTAQTLRKWLLADAIPTQAKLLALADWLGVSPQWLRFGKGVRKTSKAASENTTDDVAAQAGVIVISQQHVALVPMVELLTRLSPANVRLVENIVRCVLAEQDMTA